VPHRKTRSTHERAFSGYSPDDFRAVRFADLAMAALQQPFFTGELSQSEQQRLIQLSDEANKMRERIQALEAILDAEHPNWRDR
jgi:phage shock protein B